MPNTITMTLPDKLRDAARHPKNWDVPGLLEDAASRLDDAEFRLGRIESLGVDSGALPNSRREVVPGWTLEELLSREG